MKLQVQPYAERHKQAVIALILTIQQNEFNIPITLEQQPDLNEIPDFYQSGKGNFWVALIGNDIVGTIGLRDIGNNNGALRKMFVKDTYRGKTYGVGQALLELLLSWATETKLVNVYLGTTAKFLAAQRFYEQNGFTEINVSSLPKEFPIMQVDVKFYRYELSAF